MSQLPSLSTLSPEQIRTMCAEHGHGFKWSLNWTGKLRYLWKESISYNPFIPAFGDEELCYDYMGKIPALSLDAVAELEAGLTDEEFRKYRSNLGTITNPHADEFSNMSDYIAAWQRCETSASALQRASAFLLVRGLVSL